MTGYPYCALLAFSGTRTQLIAAVEGCASAARLLGVLQQAVSDHGGHLAVEQADANERVRARDIKSPLPLAGFGGALLFDGMGQGPHNPCIASNARSSRGGGPSDRILRFLFPWRS